jgi:hypothetical protein
VEWEGIYGTLCINSESADTRNLTESFRAMYCEIGPKIASKTSALKGSFSIW